MFWSLKKLGYLLNNIGTTENWNLVIDWKAYYKRLGLVEEVVLKLERSDHALLPEAPTKL